MIEIEESNLKFSFTEGVKAIKFDDKSFYRKDFNNLPSGKGVDILADSLKLIQFIEIKNCKGHESENLWRTSINNSKISSAPHDLDVDGRESLDIEISKKVASTIVCLYGAWTKSNMSENAKELLEFWKGANSNKIIRSEKPIMIILFLEGDFDGIGIKSRSKKMIMQSIQTSIKKKLSWLNCKISVVDSRTYNERYFNITNV